MAAGQEMKVEIVRGLALVLAAGCGALATWLVNSPTKPGNVAVRTTFVQSVADKNWKTPDCMDRAKRALVAQDLIYAPTTKYDKGEEAFEDQLNIETSAGTGFLLCVRDSNSSGKIISIVAGMASDKLNLQQIREDRHWKSLTVTAEAISNMK